MGSPPISNPSLEIWKCFCPVFLWCCLEGCWNFLHQSKYFFFIKCMIIKYDRLLQWLISSAFLTNFRFVSHPYACSKSLDVLYQRLWRFHWNRCEKCCLPWANRWDCHCQGYRHVQVFGVLFLFSFLITLCNDT